jgi:hypothetical protein
MRPGPSVFARPDCVGKEPTCPRGTNPGRTYRFYTGVAVVPFGFGLSYTTWKYAATPSAAAVAGRAVSLAPVRQMLAATAAAGRRFPDVNLVSAATPMVGYTITVTNTGSVDADDVVLGFVVPPGAGTNGVPLKQLFGFERVHVQAGQSVTVFLYPEATVFTQVGPTGDRAAVPGEYTIQFGLEESSELGMGFAEHTLHTA